MSLTVLPGFATAASCHLAPDCVYGGACATRTLELGWTDGQHDQITIDGITFPAIRSEDGTAAGTIRTANGRFDIRMAGPMITVADDRTFVTITPAENTGDVRAIRMTVPKRYSDYEAARAARETFRGTCEGLF